MSDAALESEGLEGADTAFESVLDRSDEEIASMDLSTFEASIKTEASGEQEQEQETEGEEQEESSEAESEETEEKGEGEEETETEGEGEGEKEEEDGEGEGEEESEGEEEEETPTADAQLKALFAPFKANGKEMQIESVDDARQLMQMGANYNKKMAALKPSLKLMKMLDNNDLLDEGQLSYLIDLNKKDPAAIAKFVKESGIDPLDLDVEKATEYKPNTYTVDDKEVELGSVLEEISDSPKYHDTIDTVSNKWDAASKQVLVSNPQIIKVINEHMENGIYAQISGEIERDRMLGRLDGVSDLEAYRQVGDRMHAEGKFGGTAANANGEVIKPKPKPKTDPKLVERKKAAAVPKAKPAKKTGVDLNPLSMSDEEFEKSFSTKFL